MLHGMRHSPTTAADLRAAIARHNIPIFLVAATAGRHPATLGRWLNERAPLPPDAAQRILDAIQRLTEARRTQ
jgi:hypothetical protein